MDWVEQFRLQDVDAGHPAMQVTMPLVSIHDGELQCIGTAFAVAPGLAITAEHVVDSWLYYQECRNGYKRTGATFSVVAFQWFEGKVYGWVVDAMYASRSADIAFLRFQRPGWWGDAPGQVRPRCARLNFNPPVPGNELRVFGFPNSEMKDGVLYVSPSECLARVRWVDLKTDKTMRPLSHVEVDGEIFGGMSGGPCFDRDWNVVGVNSKGWDFFDSPPLAYVALLWPAMRIQIDLFKTGAFPAIDLFKEGPARALGYRRVHVSSKGQARLANVDPDDLVPLYLPARAEHMEGALKFAASNAQEALAEVQVLLNKALSNAEPLNTNWLHRALRHYFWELDSMLRVALGLAALRAGLAVDSPVGWDQFVAKWRNQGADVEALDDLAALGFSWHGVDLFEIRTYAELCRGGVPHLDCEISAEEQVICVMLGPCRKGGLQVHLPDGLNRFLDASRRFVQSLLHLSNGINVSRPPSSEE